MDIRETTKICKAIASIKPAQKFEEETAAIWQAVLADVRYEDARQAIINIAGRNPWIGADDIITEVKAIRRERLEHADRVLPDVDPDDVTAWLAARRAGIRALADGAPPPAAAAGELDGRVRAAIPGVFRRPPRILRVAIEGGEKPPQRAVKPPPTLPEKAAADAERERARQAAALEALIDRDATG